MQKATGNYCTYSIPGKTAALVAEFAVKDFPLGRTLMTKDGSWEKVNFISTILTSASQGILDPRKRVTVKLVLKISFYLSKNINT